MLQHGLGVHVLTTSDVRRPVSGVQAELLTPDTGHRTPDVVPVAKLLPANIIPTLQQASCPDYKELGMAEDQVDRRKDYLKELAPWTKLFSAFKVALDPKKLLLAAGGILVMSLGWYVLSVIFFSTSSKRPEWPASYVPDSASDDKVKLHTAWDQFKRDRHQWYLLYEMAGTPEMRESADKKTFEPVYVASDLADECNSPEEFDLKKRNGVIPK